MTERYWIETLGCPKNRVDSDKLTGTLTAEGLHPAVAPEEADLVVVNTCAFIEAAREESIETVLALSGARRSGARLVVTGCMAERYRDELAEALPEVDLVAPFGTSLTTSVTHVGRQTGTPVALAPKPRSEAPAPEEAPLPSFDLLNLPRPPATAPWSYVKVAEGCDRNCGFCAIPSFRGRQRSRPVESLLDEVEQLDGPERGLREVVLVAQDLASYGLDRSAWTEGIGGGHRAAAGRPITGLIAAVAAQVPWVRVLYLYPSALDDALVDTILGTGVPYFDLSLQHVSRPLVKRMRRWGEGDRFLERIRSIRASSRRRPSGPRSSSGTRGRPSPTTTGCSSGSTRPSSTGSGSSPSVASSAPTRPTSTTRCRPSSSPNAFANAPSGRTPSPPGSETS